MLRPTLVCLAAALALVGLAVDDTPALAQATGSFEAEQAQSDLDDLEIQGIQAQQQRDRMEAKLDELLAAKQAQQEQQAVLDASGSDSPRARYLTHWALVVAAAKRECGIDLPSEITPNTGGPVAIIPGDEEATAAFYCRGQ